MEIVNKLVDISIIITVILGLFYFLLRFIICSRENSYQSELQKMFSFQYFIKIRDIKNRLNLCLNMILIMLYILLGINVIGMMVLEIIRSLTVK